MAHHGVVYSNRLHPADEELDAALELVCADEERASS
jgi:hypothetical protein